MSKVTTNTVQMRKAASEIEELNRQFQSHIKELVSEKDELCTMWDGEAKQAFQAAFNKSIDTLESFYSTIEKYLRAINEAAAGYEKAEQKAADLAH